MTRTGRGVLVLAALLILAGMAGGYTELAVVGLAFLGVLVAAVGWLVARPRLDADRDVQPSRVSAGTSARGVLTVTNLAHRRSPAMVVLESFDGEAAVDVPIPSLEPGASHTKPYPLPTDRRGVFTVGPLVVSRADPFGLLGIGQRQRSTRTLWVHPATHDITPFPSGLARDLDGPTSGEAPEGGIAFHSLREYVRGDDLRLVHWRSSARTGTLMVRHNVDTHQPRSLLLLDTRREVYPDDSFEDAVRVVASIVVASVRRRFPVRVATTCGQTFGSDRAGGSADLLDRLAALETVPTGGFTSVVGTLGGDRGGFSLVVVTGTSSADDLVVLGPLRSRYENMTICRLGVRGPASVHELPGALLFNAGTSAQFASMWARRVKR